MSARQDSQPTISVLIGTAAREARKQAKLTQEEVAERVGIAPEVYGRMERGVITPSVPTLRKLCETLRVNASGLLGIEVPQTLAPSAPRQASKEEDPPEFRKLLRRLRTLDKAQLAVIKTVASLMQTQSARRSPPMPTQGSSKSARRNPHGK